MVLYLDIEFMNLFTANYLGVEESRVGYIKLNEIFSRFTELDIVINLKNEEEFNEYVNPHLERIKDNNVSFKFVDELKTVIEANCTSDTALAFVQESQEWCMEHTQQNVKVANIDTFENVLMELMGIDRVFDMSEPQASEFGFKGWKDLSYLSGFTNELIISDKYILNATDQKPLDVNIVKLAKSILKEVPCQNRLKIYIDFKNPDNLLAKIVASLKEIFEPHGIELEVVKLVNEKSMSGAELHDRYGYGAFYLMEVGTGFALFRKTRLSSELIPSTSRLRVESIMERSTYRTWNNHLRIINKYYSKVSNPDIVGSVKYCFS
jgi:hypothetical protein